jgi:NHS family xanthosine MFS transporter
MRGMAHKLESRLGLMMFLEYVIWGSWLPLIALYLSQFLHFTGADIGWIFATPAIASVFALLVGGQIADPKPLHKRIDAL